MIEFLPRIIEEAPDRPPPREGVERIRAVTRQAAFDPESWTPERAAKVAELFDGMACEWHTRQTVTRMDPLRDALERGGSMLWDEFASRYGDDVDESPYWDEAIPTTVMGRLRVHGFLAEATVDGDVFVTVPVELRPIIGRLLGTGQGVPDGKRGRGDKRN